MRFLLLFLLFAVQMVGFGANTVDLQNSNVKKELTLEKSDLNERSYKQFRYYSPDSGTYISQDPIGLEGGANFYSYVPDTNSWIDPFGLNNVSTGAGRTHVKYTGIKNGKPYHGYASAPSSLELESDEIIARRYGNNFDDFDVAPEADYTGKGVEGKQTARGLEQRGFEADGKKAGTSNAQNPVGPNNKNRQKYLDAADAHNKKKMKVKGCG